MAKQENTFLSQAWGLVVAEGVAAIFFGLALLFWPGATLAVLIGLFGLFVVVWGIVGLIKSVASIGKVGFWWIELLFSVLIVGLGVFLLRNPILTLATFILLIGLTFIFRGLVDVVTALFSREEDVRQSRALYFIIGLVGIIAGVIVLQQPVASGLAFVWIVGLYTLLQGSFLIAMSVRSRELYANR